MKRLFMCLICIITLICLANCQRYENNFVYVHIKSDYYEEFMNKEIKKEDFEFDDISNIVFYGVKKDNVGIIYLTFINPSDNKTKKFIKHCENLDFVLEVERERIKSFNCSKYDDETITVYIKLEYYEEFINKEIQIEDFESDNIESIVYGMWIESLEEGYMYVHLKKPSMWKAKKLIKHCEKLDFVSRAELDEYAFIDDPGYIRRRCEMIKC